MFASFAVVEAKSLWRMRTATVFFLAVPLLLSAILGSAVSGVDGRGAEGRSILGWAVMFSFMTVNYSGQALYREFWDGTWRRVALVAPAKIPYLLAKALPVAVVAMLQLGSFTAIAVVTTDVGGWRSIGQLGLVFAGTIAAGIAGGLLLFVVTRTMNVFSSLVYLILICFAALGGAIVASSRLPGPARTIGAITPHHWAMRGVDEVAREDGSWATVLGSTGVLLALALVVALVAGRSFDYRKEHFDG